jgi:hypothetical protein
MRFLLTNVFCLALFCAYSQKQDLPFHIYLVEPNRKCISVKELSKVTKVKITDTSISIASFYFVYMGAKDTVFLKISSSELQGQALNLIRSAKKGDVIMISSVHASVNVNGHLSNRILAEGIDLTVGCKEDETIK